MRPLRLQTALAAGALILALATAIALLISRQGLRQPLRIGFIGGLTGRVADLGIAGRDATQLAVEAINAGGGIGGRPLELLVADDGQDPAQARTAFAQLDRAGCVAVIGPMTSAMAMALTPLADAARLPLISPTVSSDDLSGRDDFFFRVAPATASAFGSPIVLAGYAHALLRLETVVILADADNASYTRSWADRFQQTFETAGGRVVERHSFRSADRPGYADLAHRLNESRAQAVVLVTSAMDAALMIQALRREGSPALVLVCEWAATEDLVRLGGRSVEGMVFVHSFDRSHPAADYQKFRHEFRRRFGYEAGFASATAWEAVMLLQLAFSRGQGREDIRKALAGGLIFNGLQEPLRLDRWGDIQRPSFLLRIEDGAYRRLDGP